MSFCAVMFESDEAQNRQTRHIQIKLLHFPGDKNDWWDPI